MPAMWLRILSLRNAGNWRSRKVEMIYGVEICKTVRILVAVRVLVASLPSPAVRSEKSLTNQPHLGARQQGDFSVWFDCVLRTTMRGPVHHWDRNELRVQCSLQHERSGQNILRATQDRTKQRSTSAVMKSRTFPQKPSFQVLYFPPNLKSSLQAL